MRRGRSTGKPTTEEAARIVAAKEGPCMPCTAWAERGNMPEDDIAQGGDYDHAKSGNIRRGHRFGYCNCDWHHRGIVPTGRTHAWMRGHFGPSKMDGGKLYAAAYGSEDELIERQSKMLDGAT